MTNPRVMVIGAGISGLCTSIRLARMGMQVTLLEKNPQLGGQLGLCCMPDPRRKRTDQRPFRFASVDPVLTLPFAFMDLFEFAGRDVRDHLPIVRLDPATRYCWSDGMVFELRSNQPQLANELSRLWPGDSEGFFSLLDRGRRIWSAAEPLLSHAPQHLARSSEKHPLTLLRLMGLPLRMGLLTPYARLIDRHVHSKRLRQVLYHYATRTGADPRHAPALLASAPWIEHYYGAWRIEGGMQRLVHELESIARALQIDIRTGCPVQQIILDRALLRAGSRTPDRTVAAGVTLSDGGELGADAIVAACDINYARERLLPPELRPAPGSMSRGHRGASRMVLMLGVDARYPQLAFHNCLMPDDYTSYVRDVFEQLVVPHDPCMGLWCPTRADPAAAPDGCECLTIVASVSDLTRSALDWSIHGPRFRDQIIQTLEQQFGLKDLSKRIVVERTMTPADFLQAYNSTGGSTGMSRRAALLHRSHRDGLIDRLYYTGPAPCRAGGDVSMSALSAKVVSELVQATLL